MSLFDFLKKKNKKVKKDSGEVLQNHAESKRHEQDVFTTFTVPLDENNRFTPFLHGDNQGKIRRHDTIEVRIKESLYQVEREKLTTQEKESEKEVIPLPNPWRMRSMIAILIVVFIAILVFFLPIPFGRVVVEGNTSITAYSLVKTGVIKSPVNILQINRMKLESSLKDDLRVGHVETQYAFPATLHIHIIPRTIVANVMGQFGYGAVDKNGQCIEFSSALPNNNAPIISGIKVSNILLGDTIQNKNIKVGLNYLGTLAPQERAEISEVNVGDVNHLVAYSINGIRLELGDEKNMAEKAKLSIKMLNDVKDKNMAIDYLNVNLDAPLVKLLNR